MGEPILDGPKVPTTLAPTKGNTVVEQTLEVNGHKIKFTCVSMGNPHAVTYSIDGKPIKVRWGPGARMGVLGWGWGWRQERGEGGGGGGV